MKKVFAKFLAVIIAVMLILSTCPIAFAADGDIASGTAGDGVTWVLNSSGTLTISGEGAIEVGYYAPPWENYNDSILNIVVEEGITAIPSTAFCYAENLETLSIPSSVTEMPINETPIFWGNSSLEAINVHQDNTAFTSVDGIVFSKDKTMLYLYPMSKADDSYTIPDTVTNINAYAFSFNETLKSVIISDTVIELGEKAFYEANFGKITIGSGIRTIPYGCFTFNVYLKEIVIPDSVQTMEFEAFWYCNNLKNVFIGSGVKTIESNVFTGCEFLTAVHYNGTADTWGEITIDAENEKLNSLPVHYSSDLQYKEAVGADCTTDGHTAGDYCNVCADYVTGEVTEYAWGHNYIDGVCQREDCGYACEHINEEFDNKCDECGVEVELELSEISVGETKTAYIEESDQDVYVKFVPEESGQYILYSDNGGDDENIDPYATLYDSEFNEIGYNDDDDNSYNFELTFDAGAGETYYFALSSYDSDVDYSYTLDKHIDIAHQPTSVEPYVDITWDMDATYQWYTVEISGEEITNQNADTVAYDWGESSYNAENGWSGVLYQEDYYEYDFFTVSLDAGETVTVELIGDYTNGVGLYDYNNNNDVWLDVTNATIYELTVDEAGDYTFYTYSDSGDLTVKAYFGELQYTEIDGQNTNTLDGGVIGENYVCMVALEDSVLISDVLNYTYAITHQPTEQDPYVEVNDNTNAKYQWYTVTEEIAEVTDEDVSFEGFPSEMELPTYETQDGWTGIPTAEDTVFFFTVSLEAGETVKFVANEYAQAVALFMPVEGGFGYSEYFDESREATLTAQVAGDYYVIALGTTHARLKAYKQEFTYTKINGETAAEFKTTDKGLYACEVTFADGSTEMSQILNTNYQPGDVNDDGFVNARDCALIMQYTNGWDVKIVEYAADANADGQINSKDYALLVQYINGWNVTLG